MTDSPDSSLFGEDVALAPVSPPPAYRVLARKYRPGSFSGLIGQQAMVQTLANAIKRDRLAQAWLLTGVRGVGKTSTARIIARALNCIGPDGSGGPTIDPCGECEHCRQIASGSHMDVIEMDAASNTGVDDVREIIEAVRYAAVSARYKIYIIDEVHMLTKNAFNALLKTLEEPPPHVKFIFATTEVQKLPVTVLSRCQRFDLRRVPAETLVSHFAGIAEAESIVAEPEALALIARAAEGSVRDGLSLLDQAIAHGGDTVSAAQVRDMLGLADRGAVRTLFGLCLAGDAPAMLAALAEQHDLGREPEALLRELLGLVHAITRQRIAPGVDPSLSREEQEAIADWATALDMPKLHRLWQLLLKGLADVQAAPHPMQATEMALLRLIHASELPDPGELLRTLANAPPAPAPAARNSAPAPAPAAALSALPADYAGLVALFQAHTEPALAHQLSDELRLVSYAPEETPPRLVLATGPGARRDQLAAIPRLLSGWTGTDWQVDFRSSGGGPTLHEAQKTAAADRTAAARQDPLVAALISRFPDAELLGVDTPPAERNANAQSR
ncbi:DNA polymerase III subunit gamma/tau [Polymorphobacter sp.]|uniref:DNA polymerase III subunit gamma/tau n=1 Tax=Polymorphobacter sp. TaxID=1909290 RepID=UPI003F6EFA70